MSDNELIESILNGNTANFKLLIKKYQQFIFRTCIGYVHNEDDANDLTQDTFINAYSNLHKFKRKAEFKTWLYRIAINRSLNHLRSKKRNLFERLDNISENEQKSITLPDIETNNPEKILIENEHRLIIQQELNKLSYKQKTAFILSKYDNLSQKEIAQIMNISEGAVESLIQRAKTSLYKKLSEYFKKK